MNWRAKVLTGLSLIAAGWWPPQRGHGQQEQVAQDSVENAPTPPFRSMEGGSKDVRSVNSEHPLETPQVDLERRLRRYRSEPSIEQVVRAATNAYKKQGANLASLADRARLRGLVPTLSVSARHGQALDLATSQTAVTDQLRVGTDRDLTLQAALTFELPRLVFAREEISVVRESRASSQQRQQVIEQVVALYFERRRLQLQRDRSTSADVDLHLRIAELTALLDAFTGGAFSTMIKKRATREADATSNVSVASKPQPS